ncbi:MAG: GNAT family N-acetyltransferase [bacterium]|nr:GNAT family N-acetyltransferase [bacterium]
MKIYYKRVVSDKDWHWVAKIEKKIGHRYYQPFALNRLKEYFRRAIVFLIEVSDRPAGYFAYKINKSKNDGEILAMGILSKHRRQGVASRAIKKAFEELKDCKKIIIVVHPGNVPAVNFYLKNGFKISTYKENYFGDKEPRFILCKDNNK